MDRVYKILIVIFLTFVLSYPVLIFVEGLKYLELKDKMSL